MDSDSYLGTGSNNPNDPLSNITSPARSPSYSAKKLKRRLTSRQARVPAGRTDITHKTSSATSSTSHFPAASSSTTLATATTDRTSIPASQLVTKGEREGKWEGSLEYPRLMSGFRNDSDSAVDVRTPPPASQTRELVRERRKGRVLSLDEKRGERGGDFWGDFDGTYDAVMSSEDTVKSSSVAVNSSEPVVKPSSAVVKPSPDAVNDDFVGARSNWMTVPLTVTEQQQNTTAVISPGAAVISSQIAVNSTPPTPSSNSNPSSSSNTIFYDAPSRQSPRNSNTDSSPHHSMDSHTSSSYSSPPAQNEREALAIDVKYKYPDLPMPRIRTSVPGNVNGRGYEIDVSCFSTETSPSNSLRREPVSPLLRLADGGKKEKKKMTRKEKKMSKKAAQQQNQPLRAIEKLSFLQRLKRTFHLTPSQSPTSSIRKHKSPSPQNQSHENLLSPTETTSTFPMRRTASQLSAHNKALRKAEKQEAKRLSKEAKEELKNSLQQQDRVRWEKGLSLSSKSMERISKERRASGVAVIQMGNAPQAEANAGTSMRTGVKGEGKLARTKTKAKRVFGVLKKTFGVGSGEKDAYEAIETITPLGEEQNGGEPRDHSLRDRHIKALEESRALARTKAKEGSRALSEKIAVSGSRAHDFADPTEEKNWI